MTKRYAEYDCVECQQVIQFIEEKMEFLTKKMKRCSKQCSCTTSHDTPICLSCCKDAESTMPKAYERYVLGPKLLVQARKELAKAQELVKTLS